MDTLQVASQPEGWSLANKIALAAVIVSALLSVAIFVLQWKQNQMVERHERDRLALDEKLRAQQTEAASQRIGWTAFQLVRQLRSWLDEPITQTGGRLPADLIRHVQNSPVPDTAALDLLARWATERCSEPHSSTAQKRAEILIDSAPAAGEQFKGKAINAFRIFHEAIGHLNKGLVHMRDRRLDAALSNAQKCFVNGYDALEVCILRLEDLVPEALQAELVFLRGVPYTLRTYAPSISVEPSAP